MCLMSPALAGEFLTTSATSSGKGKAWKIPKGAEGGISGARKEEGQRFSRYLRPLFKDLPYARLTLGAEEQERG